MILSFYYVIVIKLTISRWFWRTINTRELKNGLGSYMKAAVGILDNESNFDQLYCFKEEEFPSGNL